MNFLNKIFQGLKFLIFTQLSYSHEKDNPELTGFANLLPFKNYKTAGEQTCSVLSMRNRILGQLQGLSP